MGQLPRVVEGEGRSISEAEVAGYKEAGVLIKHSFFSPQEVAAMQRTVREFKRSDLLYDMYTGASGEDKGQMLLEHVTCFRFQASQCL